MEIVPLEKHPSSPKGDEGCFNIRYIETEGIILYSFCLILKVIETRPPASAGGRVLIPAPHAGPGRKLNNKIIKFYRQPFGLARKLLLSPALRAGRG